MNIINFKEIILTIVVMSGICTACSDVSNEVMNPDVETGLNLYVPFFCGFDTRSETEEVKELKYSSLFFFAFPTDNSRPTITSLVTENNTLSLNNAYRQYKIDLSPGIYKFYLIANFYEADCDVSDLPQTGDDLEKEIYTLSQDYNCQIPEKGIPMSASYTDFFIKNSEGENSSMATDGFYYDGKGEDVYAMMSFLFAKITLIPMDGFGMPTKIKDVTFSNISEKEPIFFDGEYSNFGSREITVEDEETEETPESVSFYIPERIFSESNPRSTLSFKIGEKSVVLPLGETADTEEGSVIKLPLPDEDRFVKIARGSHYTYTLSTLADITLEVSDWSPIGISAGLTGPVYLQIEKQAYEVKAGEETAIWFSSDADDIHILSPTYLPENETIPLNLYNYSVDEANDSIRVWVNPEIKSSEYSKILKSIGNKEGKYDHFHIVAGNIYKRIEVTPLTLDYYLNINPENVAIDVRLRISSGEYQGDIPVTIRTNYPYVKVSLTDQWNSLPEDEFGPTIEPENYPLKLREMTYDDNNSRVFTNQVTTSRPSVVNSENGSVYYGVSFRDLNSGLEIWKDDRSLTVKVEGLLEENGVADKTEYFTVKIEPLILNYKIHFKSANQIWDSPHIYVYQCLEFPSDYNAAAPEGGLLASRPVGYKDGNNYLAALEYSFTGSIVFRGWNYPSNYELLYETDGTIIDNITARLNKKEGFFIFNDITVNNSLNPNNNNTSRYNFNMDFCEAYRLELKDKGYCSDCYDNINRLWPGIRMMPEEDGWYVFELTGIATPGKALIMFANGHNSNKVNAQFPGGYQVGIPLFDFPSKEGWLLYDNNDNDRVNNQFLPTDNLNPIFKYRIYWPKNVNNNEFNYVHLWLDDIADITKWPGLKGTLTASGDYYYAEFITYQSKSSLLGYLFNRDGLVINGDKFTLLETFTYNQNLECNCAYYEDGELHSGIPDF